MEVLDVEWRPSSGPGAAPEQRSGVVLLTVPHRGRAGRGLCSPTAPCSWSVSAAEMGPLEGPAQGHQAARLRRSHCPAHWQLREGVHI